MTPELLQTVGQALYGHQWQSELARALGIADRTMRRWFAGSYPVPNGIELELADLCKARGGELLEIAEKLISK